MPKHMTQAEREEAVALYTSRKMTREELCDRFFRAKSTIDNLLKRRKARLKDLSHDATHSA